MVDDNNLGFDPGNIELDEQVRVIYSKETFINPSFYLKLLWL